jgi:hypothetical protein
MSFHVPNRYRLRVGPYGSSEADGNNGVFSVPPVQSLSKISLRVIASDGGDWEHVSVSLPSRCPTWDEMCAIKALFWDGQDCVMQFHPPESEYVNNHRFCLHLWRPVGRDFETPPRWMVGVPSLGVLA